MSMCQAIQCVARRKGEALCLDMCVVAVRYDGVFSGFLLTTFAD